MQLFQLDQDGLAVVDRDDLSLPVLQAVLRGPVGQAGYWPRLSRAGGLVAYANGDWETPGLAPTARLGRELLYGLVLLVGVDAHGRHRSLVERELDAVALRPGAAGEPPALVVTPLVDD